MSWTLKQLALWCGAKAAPEFENVEVTGVTIDSRKAGPGSLFVALKGEKADGHDYAAAAEKAGAAAVLVSGRWMWQSPSWWWKMCMTLSGRWLPATAAAWMPVWWASPEVWAKPPPRK